MVKIASGFYRNSELGLSSSDGLMLLFRQASGEPVALLEDRGRLTDLRTAVAGAIAAKQLAPHPVARIGAAAFRPANSCYSCERSPSAVRSQPGDATRNTSSATGSIWSSRASMSLPPPSRVR